MSGSFRYFLSNVAMLNSCDALWLRDPCERTTRQQTVIQDSKARHVQEISEHKLWRSILKYAM